MLQTDGMNTWLVQGQDQGHQGQDFTKKNPALKIF